MHRSIASRVADIVSSRTRELGGKAYLERPHEPWVLSAEAFQPIPSSSARLDAGDLSSPIASVAYIDGGNAELLASSIFSLSRIQVAGAIFRGRECLGRVTESFYCLASIESGQQKMDVDIIGTGLLSPFSIAADEQCLTDGVFKARIGRTGELVRRMAELTMMHKLAAADASRDGGSKTSGPASGPPVDVVVRDGTLQMQSAPERAIGLPPNAAALTKTSGLLTDSGAPLSALARSLAPQATWHVPAASLQYPGVKATMHLVCLSDRSRRIFRLETLAGLSEALPISDLCISLAQNATDPVFLGYPFGLIEANRLARIEDPQREAERLRLLQPRITEALQDRDAHDVLDGL